MTLILEARNIRELVNDYNLLADDADWNRFRLSLRSDLDPELLSEGQKEAIVFVTHIENHTPGYIRDYLARFPIDGNDEIRHTLHNRELFRFVIRWGVEEDRHAEALSLYQISAGITSGPDALLQDLIEECVKPFSIGYPEPVQVFTYTFLQEKATQLYYQSLARAVREPVLKKLLLTLAKDESRHFVFFSKIIDAYLDAFGERAVEMIEEVAISYRMPLYNTLKDYRRRAIRMAKEAPGYDRKIPVRILGEHLEKAIPKHPDLEVPLRRAASRLASMGETPDLTLKRRRD
jgi:acyl-[acyl-carrier-protein] desaturase